MKREGLRDIRGVMMVGTMLVEFAKIVVVCSLIYLASVIVADLESKFHPKMG